MKNFSIMSLLGGRKSNTYSYNLTISERNLPGFTLAEVLITIGIIGVVATMTIPILMNNIRERQTVVKLREIHSIFSQAFKLAVNEYGEPEGWDIGESDSSAGSQKLLNIITSQMKNSKVCGNNAGCLSSNYKAMFGDVDFTWQPNSHLKYAKGVLLNGVQYVFWTRGSGCTADYSKSGNGSLSKVCGGFYVDINGNAKPNRAGVDYFLFIITVDGILPAGLPDYNDPYNVMCKYNSQNNTNGAACTAWVLDKQNLDYLKRNISW